MKNALMKTLVIAALVFCSNLRAKSNNCVALIKKAKVQQNFNISKGNYNNYQIVHMYGLPNIENLKAHHVGARFFNPSHNVPTAKDLTDSIRSHPYFVGTFEKELSREEYMAFKSEINHQFFLFETYQNGKSDFYMGNQKGLRHFSVEELSDQANSMAGISNSLAQDYPSLESFIACTLKFHADKYMI